MHRAAVWQHSSNSNRKIVHNSIEQILWNLSDLFFDDVLSCLWIVFTKSVFQVPPQKIVRRVEILGIGLLGVIDLMQNESAPGEVMPEVFKCSNQEMRWRQSLNQFFFLDLFLNSYIIDFFYPSANDSWMGICFS